MLSVSGLLTSKNSGPPQWPDLPREVLEANPAFLDDNETKTKGWYPSAPGRAALSQYLSGAETQHACAAARDSRSTGEQRAMPAPAGIDRGSSSPLAFE